VIIRAIARLLAVLELSSVDAIDSFIIKAEN
jgi:hypothetical protein